MWDPRLPSSSSSSSSALAAVIELPQLHTDTIRALAFREDPQQVRCRV
jgi:hypothetical protein